MTAETSNARGEVVAERQAWYEQQIALAEGQWAAAFLDRWECGDDVPSKEHYVALWLAERAAPPPAAARGDVRGFVDALVDAAYQDGMQELDAMSDETLSARSALEQALAAEGVQAEPKAEARGVVDARRLAVGLWQRHYREVAPEWEPCPDLAGLLSQIDNMASGLRRFDDTAPPSAPVGVEEVVMAARNAENTIRNCAAAGQIGDGYVQYADALRDAVQRLAQRPAAVDGAARRRDVRLWMRHNAGSYSTATELAEAADEVFNLPDGGLDNETHWVWDEAAEAVDDSQRGGLA